ncbi:FtsB family cell division protein [Jeotgalibaca ciconiae]|uniref:Cell division protein DIVIC n=1 Tax=Jeotgalibaca ciconiae TaxID=2496265 RepID=A0A3Q9BJJ2_9LACT|nr:septum formation initiator family protein [Jeotgalibaca ciconiae]AZP03839.1 cell division protein DIVIC [Jeotgalibaca ciconiae]HJB24714.1 septum formation initiator family protein [Candidatus Jeotgalibaca pullicola]
MLQKQAKTHNEVPKQNITPIKNDYTQEQTLKKKINRSIQQKARRRMIVILLAGMLIIVPLAANIINNLFEIQTMGEKISQAKETNQTLEEENQDLKVQVGLLQDEEYIAKLARSRYYLSKDGEIIFSLPEDNQSKVAEKEALKEKSEQ